MFKKKIIYLFIIIILIVLFFFFSKKENFITQTCIKLKSCNPNYPNKSGNNKTCCKCPMGRTSC